MPGSEVGQRIARARRRRGLSQAVLAGLIGRSESWLSQVERGKRTVDSHAVLTRLSEVLRVDIAELMEPAAQDQASPRPCAAAVAIEQAMIGYGGLEQVIAGSPEQRGLDIRNLTGRTRAAYHRYQATRYEEAGRIVPGLIRDVEGAGSGTPDQYRARARVYDTAAALLNRVGEHALAWVAADRAVAAATQSGEPLLAALSAYRLAYVLPRRKHAPEAVEVAMSAAGALERAMTTSNAEYLSMYGGLHLAAASAAAACYDRSLAPGFLMKACAIAERLGKDANLMGTAFGPVNVGIHTLSVSVRLGDARRAVELGESLDAEVIPRGLIGRRTQVHLDLARAYSMRRQDAAAVNTLLTAERLSPQLVRFDAQRGNSSPGCCAANTAHQPPSCARWHGARESSDPHRSTGFLPSRQCEYPRATAHTLAAMDNAAAPVHPPERADQLARQELRGESPPATAATLPGWSLNLKDPPAASRQFDTSVPHPARVYACWLGGKDHFEADRRTAAEVARLRPEVMASARANRAFLARAVRYLAAECGIRQFVDVGTGLPAPDSTHQVAQQVDPACRVCYVDNDPLVLVHARALLTSAPEGACDYLDADVRDTAAIVAGAARTLDLSRPVAILLLAILHFIPSSDDPARIVARLAGALAPGSLIALSHLTADFAPAQVTAAATAYNAASPVPVHARTHAQVTSLFGGLPLLPPGVVPVTEWRPAPGGLGPPADLYGGVARVPRRGRR